MKRLLQIGLLLAGMAWCPRAEAIAFVEAANNFEAASASTLTITITVAAGNCAILGFRQGSNNTALSSVTDSATQTWTQVSTGSTGWDASTQGFMYFIANTAAITSVTVNLGANNANRAGVVMEFSGCATSSLEDASVKTSTASLVNSLTTAALTTTNADDALITMTYLNGSRTGWTAGTNYTIPTGGQDSTGRIAMQYRIVAATQSAITTSMSWGGAAIQAADIYAGFKSAAAGGTPVPKLTLLGVGP